MKNEPAERQQGVFPSAFRSACGCTNRDAACGLDSI
jgi:hypothetical protein